jgi:predicted AAA+ superfamily ATPase
MVVLPRLYEAVLRRHFARFRQLAFLSGPRQVGKTTTVRTLGGTYLNWDRPADRREILLAQERFEALAARPRGSGPKPLLILDEFHKHRRFKNYLKGLFDATEPRLGILVTGSARMDVYRRGSDSLAGRYFTYRMHPLSVAELVRADLPSAPPAPPAPLHPRLWERLRRRGGFPEPFRAREPHMRRRWRDLRRDQLIRGDLRDLTRIQELATLEHLALLLEERSGTSVAMEDLARKVSVSSVTVKRWVQALAGLYHGFLVHPWHRRLSRALRKEARWFDRDWSGLEERGRRFETLMACHLLKAVEGWTDLGFGEFALHYVRDKQKREVDFLVTREGAPWFLVEAKAGSDRLSPALAHFHRALATRHAFQVVEDLPYVAQDCFRLTRPAIVPAVTFLSQLL